MRKKIWDLEFLKDKLKAMRESFRIEFDRLKELSDATSRRLYGEKYEFFYIATNDKIEVASLPIMISDIEKLPDEPKETRDFRFYKKRKGNPDKDICDSLDKAIKRYQEDIDQLKKQMDGIDGQIEGPGGVNESIDGLRTVHTLLKEHMNKI
jgi:hypothetical protein